MSSDQESAARPDASAPTPVVSLRDVELRTGSQTLWSGATFTVMPQTFVAILGPNGAGKSSLLEALLGLRPTRTGEVTVLGSPAGRNNNGVGYLPQRRSFDADVRIRGVDIVRFGIDGHRWGFPLPSKWSRRGREDVATVEKAIDVVGATRFAHRPVGQVSGGEQQRLLIAQALVRSPQLLLLDEPLDSLDLPNQHAIASLVRDVSRSQRATVMMVAHDINPILPYLDQVIYVAKGRVVSGTPNEVVRSDVLSDLYDTEVEVLQTSDGRRIVVGTPDHHSHHSHQGSHGHS